MFCLFCAAKTANIDGKNVVASPLPHPPISEQVIISKIIQIFDLVRSIGQFHLDFCQIKLVN